jgi:hypothetical protein
MHDSKDEIGISIHSGLVPIWLMVVAVLPLREYPRTMYSSPGIHSSTGPKYQSI